MKTILADLKYSICEIERNTKSIEDTKIQMVEWIGKPIYKGCEESIYKWKKENIEHYKNIDYFYNELKKLRNN